LDSLLGEDLLDSELHMNDVEEFINYVNKNPTDWMFDMTNFNQATRSKISFELSFILKDNFVKLNYEKNRRMFIVGENMFGKRAYHPLSEEKLNTLIRMLRNVEFVDDGYYNTFRERDSQYWEAYNLDNTFLPEYIF
jgi:hypothetical protein